MHACIALCFSPCASPQRAPRKLLPFQLLLQMWDLYAREFIGLKVDTWVGASCWRD